MNTKTKKHFEGFYYRHQKDGKTVALIPGISGSGAFVQVITDRRSYNFDFGDAFIGDEIHIGGCIFRKNSVHIDLPGIRGDIKYTGLTPLARDVMGPFRFFPMECRHRVISMRHNTSGSLSVDGEIFDFSDGTGYIEGDSGRSFPRNYLWLMSNDFPDGSSIMLSLAEIPFLGFRFNGCVCILLSGGREYRFATYLGVKITTEHNKIILSQGELRLETEIISPGDGHSLSSPSSGMMTGIIKEHNNAEIIIQLFNREKEIHTLHSRHAGFENCGFIEQVRPEI